MFASTLVGLLLSSMTLVSAAPSAKRAPGPWCSNLGAGAFDIVTNFTLAAFNVDQPNANNTGIPLVLGQAGAIDGAEFKILSTFASFPFNDYPSLSMQAGAIFAHSPSGNTAVNSDVTGAGEKPGFIQTTPEPQPPQIYCAVASTDPHGGGTGFPVLAVLGDTDSFSLCPAGNFTGAQTSVVYKPEVNATSYIFDQCVPVHLQIIEAQ
ncbi:hypothetical protein QCA50_016120 [Cerrena zonata]|uniref:Uncharacterized protein n=1 Tax=Cerrena zonata TaxID=2478898 RepID=A0AAW0FPC3_9APHY